MIGELGVGGKGWVHSAKIGGGAAAGRLVATVVKAGVALAVGIALTVAAFWP
jgi:hypothetical protein